jgi:hypothetical protein
MAEVAEAGNPIVMAKNLIHDVLSSPLATDWTVEDLADRLLDAITSQAGTEVQEFILNADADRQMQRLVRPLLACLAVRSNSETGTAVNVYGGRLQFKPRSVGSSTVWIAGEFENQPGNVYLKLHCASAPSVPAAPTNALWSSGHLEQSPG